MQIVINLLRGVAIGLANIIPGVSGGTMALVLVALFYHKLVAVFFDEEFARLRGVSSNAYYLLLIIGSSLLDYWIGNAIAATPPQITSSQKGCQVRRLKQTSPTPVAPVRFSS